MRVSANRRHQLLKLGSILVLLLAVAPQVLYLGHPLSTGDSGAAARTMPAGHEHREQATAQHAGHCHVGPKGCAAADGAVNVASFDTAVQVPTHDGAMSAIDNAPLPRTFALWQRPEKPPQPI